MENLTQIDIPLKNVILIDWLTVTLHDVSVDMVKWILGMGRSDIPWDDKLAFRHGYPRRCSFQNINILYGADDANNFSDPNKARTDMGICLDMSGTGCRAFEQYGHGDWFNLLTYMHEHCSCVNVTRLDLAYDDHTGVLDINRIRRDVEERNYTGSPKKSMIIWSDDQEENLQGLTVQIGSKASAVLIRIYNKAAERGYDHTRHWVRVELQLREDRAGAAVKAILDRQDIGLTFSGILRNYCTMREPVNDSNKSRWPVAEYWQNLIGDAERIRLWIAPGEPYNYYKTEKHLVHQYGQQLLACLQIYGNMGDLIAMCRKEHPDLNVKYKQAIEAAKLEQTQRRERMKETRRKLGIQDPDPELDRIYGHQMDFAELPLDLPVPFD